MYSHTHCPATVGVCGGRLHAHLEVVSILENEPDFRILWRTAEPEHLHQNLDRPPDLVVFCGEAELLAACRALAVLQPVPRVLVVVPSRKRNAERGSHLRAAGVKVSLTTMSNLLPAARLLRSGYQVAESHAEPDGGCTPAPGRQPSAWERFDQLTEREMEVVHLILRGWSNAEIADSLMLSGATVKSHVHSLMNKLELRNRIDIITTAYTSGLVRPGVPKPNWQPRLAGSPA